MNFYEKMSENLSVEKQIAKKPSLARTWNRLVHAPVYFDINKEMFKKRNQVIFGWDTRNLLLKSSY